MIYLRSLKSSQRVTSKLKKSGNYKFFYRGINLVHHVYREAELIAGGDRYW